MAEIVAVRQWDRLERNRLPQRVHTRIGDIGIGQPVEQIVRSTVLLKNHDHVLDFIWRVASTVP